MSADTNDDVMALSGLRRLVLHARDTLHVTTQDPVVGAAAWSTGKIRAYAAQILAEQVLTLVADCLPADDVITADEAREIRREAAELNQALDEVVKQRNDLFVEREGLRSKLADTPAPVGPGGVQA